jgi:hypothetical protein
MAGVNAVSSSKTHAATGVDVAVGGWVTGQEIALSTTPTGSGYQWAQSLPSGSNAIRAALSTDDDATVKFTPDAPGIYAISVVVDGTTYIIRLLVARLATSSGVDVLLLPPIADSQVAAPALGRALYFSSDQNAVCLKDPDDNVFTVDVTAV